MHHLLTNPQQKRNYEAFSTDRVKKEPRIASTVVKNLHS